MAGRFEGKVAIVTGGASGIGRATAMRLASEGASVLVADRDDPMGAETIALIEAAGGTASFERVDVRSEDSVASMVATAVERYGGLDVAHNNAGVVDNPMRITDMGGDRWDRMIATNLSSVFYCLKHEIPAMLERGGGAIVNTSSGAGVAGTAMLSHYSAAKHGVIGLTRSASDEFVGAGIRVNAICPGLVDTPLVQGSAYDTGLKADPAQMAEVVAWLLSGDSSWVSGQAIEVNGGGRRG